MKELFLLPVRVYTEDTDTGGIVYHSRYLNFMERARTEWLFSQHGEAYQAFLRSGKLFVVHTAALTFHKSAQYGDSLTVSLLVEEIGRAKVLFLQEVRKDGTLLCTGHISLAAIARDSGKPVRLSDTFLVDSLG